MKRKRSAPTATVAGLGERRLIEAIRRWLGPVSPPPPHGIGDDCAVVPASGGPTLVTVDPVIRGRHFDDTLAAARVGAKLLKRNLSDIAAMGGTPRHAVVALAAPRDLPVTWLRQFYRGLARTARTHGVAIVGGDCTQTADFLGAFLTLTGDAPARPLLRSGAAVGDLIFVTGTLGGSILGKHHRFTPRLDEGRWLAARREVTAALDVSDGLGKDALALAPPAGAIVIDPRTLPSSRAARVHATRTQRDLLDTTLNDGEDYELVFTARPEGIETFIVAWHRAFTTPLSCIGRVIPRRPSESPLRFDPPLPPGVRPHGYEHFR